MDVVSLYPSLDQQGSAALVKEAFMGSDIKVDYFDYEAATLYLALTLDKEEIEREGITQWLPRRNTNKGRKPTVRTPRIAGPLPKGSRTDNVKRGAGPCPRGTSTQCRSQTWALG